MKKVEEEEDVEEKLSPNEFGYRKNLNDQVGRLCEINSNILMFPTRSRGEMKIIPINIVNFIYGVQHLIQLLKPYWDSDFIKDYNEITSNGSSTYNMHLLLFGLIMDLMGRKRLLLEIDEEEEIK